MLDWLFGKKKEPGTALALTPEVTRVNETVVDDKTIVYMRAIPISYPAVFWEAEVFYDAWGVPYARGDWTDPNGRSKASCVKLRPGGRASDTKYAWKHKSGPDVVFPNDEPWSRSFHPKGWQPEIW